MRQWLCIILCMCSVYTLSAQQTPKDFNDQVQTTMDDLYMAASVWSHLLGDIKATDKQFSKLSTPRKDLQTFIKDQISEYDDDKDIGNNKKLKASVLALLKFEKDFVERSFKPFEKLGPSNVDQDLPRLRDQLNRDAEAEKQLLQAVNDERNTYAQQNKFSLIAPPAEKVILSKPIPKDPYKKRVPLPEGTFSKQATPPPPNYNADLSDKETQEPPKKTVKEIQAPARVKEAEKEKVKAKADDEDEDGE